MNHVENEAESSKIRVKDRRRFSPEGEPLDESSDAAEPEPEAAIPAEAKPGEIGAAESADSASAAEASPSPPENQHSASGASASPAGSRQSPAASFELLVLSLAMQAELELGVHGKPEEQPPNLDVARHSIDMLGVLQEKTKGNLTFEEKRQLDNAVTMLRFRYVQAVQELNQKAKA